MKLSRHQLTSSERFLNVTNTHESSQLPILNALLDLHVYVFLHYQVVCDLLMTDLAHDDRAVSAIKRVKQLLQRTFPER